MIELKNGNELRGKLKVTANTDVTSENAIQRYIYNLIDDCYDWVKYQFTLILGMSCLTLTTKKHSKKSVQTYQTRPISGYLKKMKDC